MNNRSTIHLATDHAGFDRKNEVKGWLEANKYTVVDHGALHLDAEDDFPDFIRAAAEAVSKDPASSRAIIFGGSGQGEAMVANRYPQVRATVYYGGNEDIVVLSRQHNDANVLSIGARFVDAKTAIRAVELWLNEAPLSDEKYTRRNKKIERITKAI
jgi:ribose 5-phosphate isomerase B